MRLETRVMIERSPEEVWAFVAELRNDPNWCDKVDSVEQVAGDGPGLNASYRVLHRPVRMRRAKELAVIVEHFEPPRRLRLREEDSDAVFAVTYELVKTDGGTNLTQVDEIQWKVPFPGPQIGGLMVRRDIQRQFSALKSVLEEARDG